MAPTELESTVAQLILDHPRWISALEEYGIDYCCHGQESFARACAQRHLDPAETLRELHRLESTSPEVHLDPRDLSIPDLIDHIVTKHHHFLRQQLPSIDERLATVVRKHGGIHAELAELQTVFRDLRKELEDHMLKEEVVLFPWAQRMARQHYVSADNPPFSISHPIARMEAEHEFAGRALEQLRDLSNKYTAPADACATYRIVLEDMAALERDLHLHIHEENNILFPWLLEQENRQDIECVPLNRGN